MNAYLFVCFSLFDFKSLDKKDLKNNVKDNFLFKIHNSFNEHLKNSDSIGDFRQKIFSSSNNKILFYTGVEDKAKELVNNLSDKIDCLIRENFLIDSVFKDSRIVKIKIGKNKAKSLLCSLNILSDSNSHKIQDKKEIKEIFILFPIKFDDFHKTK